MGTMVRTSFFCPFVKKINSLTCFVGLLWLLAEWLTIMHAVTKECICLKWIFMKQDPACETFSEAMTNTLR